MLSLNLIKLKTLKRGLVNNDLPKINLKMKIKPILFLLATAGALGTAKAQTPKVAYINTQELIYAMPEVKAYVS